MDAKGEQDMKTLNEQIYEYLLRENRPVTVPDVVSDAAFKGVPAMVVGKGLLSLCSEGLANYFMKDGRIFFTTDLSLGHGPIGSQSFINSMMGGLSSFLGAASGGMADSLGSLVQAFPEEGDHSVDEALERISFSTRAKGKDFEISFPQNADLESHKDNEHEFVACFEDIPVTSMTTKMNVQDGNFSKRLMESMIQSVGMQSVRKLYTCLNAPETYHGNNAIAVYLPAAPHAFAYVGRPDGIHFLRIDWNFSEALPSRKTVCSFFEKWISTYRYSGKKQYSVVLPVNREELLIKETSPELERRIMEDYANSYNETINMINAVKNAAGSEDPVSQPTLSLCQARRMLEEAAELANELMAQATDVILHYRSVKASGEFFTGLYSISQMVVDAASDISATISVNSSKIPYYSTVDISMGAMSVVKQTVHVFPSRYNSFLELITTQRLESQSLSQEEQESVKAFCKEMKARYELANQAPVYYPDFIFEGKMIAAYLGHDKEVVVPDFATSIGASAFRNAKELEKVTLGENVTSIGFSPFEGCTALKTVRVLGDIHDIQGMLFGFSTKPKRIVQGYADSYVERYCKEQEIIFEPISEENLDCVFELNENAYDVYEGFALPRITGYKSTQDLTASERARLASDENTNHIRYGTVPSDAGFADYKDARFSFTVVNDPQDLPGAGIQIAKEIENRLNTPTLHDVYRTVEGERDKVLVRYDTMREGEDNGIPWALYVIVIARDDKVLISQIYFNGRFSHRQQQYAIDKWASRILTQETFEAKKKEFMASRRDKEGNAKVPKRRRQAGGFDPPAVPDSGMGNRNDRNNESRQLTAEGERLFADYEKDKEEIFAEYRRESDQVFQECNNSSASQLGMIRRRFQEAIDDSGRKLSRCVRKLSDDGEKLVQRGADVAFIRKMIDKLREAQEDLAFTCDINLGEYGEWNLSFSVPNDVKALPQKWESILNNHPDIAAERLKAAREAETKRVNRIIDELKKQISKLKAEETPRRQASRTAEDEFRQSASTLEKRIAEVNALYDSRIREDEERQESLKHQREECERQIQQTCAELDKAFFLAFGKKKTLQGKLDELNQQIRQMDQQIGDLGKSIDDARRNEAQELESIEQKHANLKEAMEHAQAHLEQLPAELAKAQETLADAQKRLERIPEMTLAELSVKPKQPAAMEEPKEQPAAAQAMGDEETQARIIGVLAGASSLTISEIISSDPALTQVSYMKVSTIVRRLVSEGVLIREEYMQKAYFRLR